MSWFDFGVFHSGPDAAVVQTAQQLCDPQIFEERLLSISTVLNICRDDTIHVLRLATLQLPSSELLPCTFAQPSTSLSVACRKQPKLLLLLPELLATRMLELRQVVPVGDIGRLVRLGPSVLLIDVRLLFRHFLTMGKSLCVVCLSGISAPSCSSAD